MSALLTNGVAAQEWLKDSDFFTGQRGEIQIGQHQVPMNVGERGGQTPPALVLNSGSNYDFGEAHHIGSTVFVFDKNLGSVSKLTEEMFLENFSYEEKISATDMVRLQQQVNSFNADAGFQPLVYGYFPARNDGNAESRVVFRVNGTTINYSLSSSQDSIQQTYKIDQPFSGSDDRAKYTGEITLTLVPTQPSSEFSESQLGYATVNIAFQIVQNSGLGGDSDSIYNTTGLDWSGQPRSWKVDAKDEYSAIEERIQDDYWDCRNSWGGRNCNEKRSDSLTRIQSSSYTLSPRYNGGYNVYEFRLRDDGLVGVNPDTGLNVGFSSTHHYDIETGEKRRGGKSGLDIMWHWGVAKFNPDSKIIYYENRFRNRYFEVCPYEAYSRDDVNCQRLPYAEDDLSGTLQAVYRGIKIK